MRHLAMFVLLAAMAAPASAVPITFGFGGAITDDPYGALGADNAFSGSYTFESNALDLVADAQTGVYSSVGAAYGFSSLVGGTAYSLANALTVNIANDYSGPVDQYGVIASDGVLTLELFLADFDALVFGNDALRLDAPLLASFEFAQFRLFGNGVEFLGSLDRLSCLSGCGGGAGPGPDPDPDPPTHSVPEPSTAILYLSALGIMGLARRNRKEKQSCA